MRCYAASRSRGIPSPAPRRPQRTLLSVASPTDGVAHTVHLGGFLTGYVLLRWVGISRRRAVSGTTDLMGGVKDAYRRWRMKRLRKKFESYYEKRSGGDGPPAVH